MMSAEHKANEEQDAVWNGASGAAWVDFQETLDGMFRPFEDWLTRFVSDTSSNHVLDVGCGTGSTTLAMARSRGTEGRCVGIDISQPMIALARTRAAREGTSAVFIRADAQTHFFEPESYDAIVSRFGVMFFDDSVRAFSNLRRAARAGAHLGLIVWRSADDNPFMTTAERAAASLLSNIPPRQTNEPGQFGLADPARVRGILAESRWREVDISPLDVECTFAERELTRYFSRLGPLGRMLAQEDEQTCRRVIDAVRTAFDPYVYGTTVRFNAACWAVTARAGHS